MADGVRLAEVDAEESDSGTDEADSIDGDGEIKLSDQLVMFSRDKLARHQNVFAGKILNKIEESNSNTRAIKIDFDPDKIFREAKILRTLGSHTNIVYLYEVSTFEDTHLHFSYLVLEKCHDLNLLDYMFSAETVPIYDITRGLKFCRQLVTGLKYIHEELIIHKDLKLANILLTHDLENVKIADFGSSQCVKSTSSKLHCPNMFGTLGYRPPESLNRSFVSLKSDIFSLGVVICLMLSNGISPFGPESDKWDFNTQNGEIVIPDLLVPNPMATKHLIKAMLDLKRCCRPSIDDVEHHSCWSFDLNYTYPSEEEVDDDEVFVDATPEESGYSPADELLRALEPMEAKLRMTSRPERESIFEIVWDSCDDLLSKEAERLSDTLIDAVSKLMEGKADEGSNDVKSKLPDPLSAHDVNMIGKKLGEKHPACAIILHYVAGSMVTSQNAVEAIKWLTDRVDDISLVAQQTMSPDSLIALNPTIFNACHKFMNNLLYDLRALKHVKVAEKTEHEVHCILKISRTSLIATERLGVAPNSNIIEICQEGLKSVKSENEPTKYSCYLLNNIGEARLQLGQLGDAELYLKEALRKMESSTFIANPKVPKLDRAVKSPQIELIQKNFEKLRLLQSIHSCCSTMRSHDKYRMCAALVDASEKLMPGKAGEIIKNVKSMIPRTLSADFISKIAKNLDEAHPVCAIIMHRLAGALDLSRVKKLKEAVDWIGDCIADISCVAQEAFKSNNHDSSNTKLVRASVEFMEELLLKLRAVKHDGNNNDITIREVGCVLSISRIRLNGVSFDVPLNPDTVAMCKDALEVIESNENLNKHKYRAYLLNNIGETYMQLDQLVDAEQYLNKALELKKAFAYRAIENKNRDIGITVNNLRKLRLLNDKQN